MSRLALGLLITTLSSLSACEAGRGSSAGAPATPATPASRPPRAKSEPGWGPSSVCAFQGPLALPPADASGQIAVPPNHPLIGYVGRVDCRGPRGPVLGFVGSSVHVAFVGTGLSLRLRDFGTGTPQTTNYYDVSVDGRPPTLLQVSPQQELYLLAEGLEDGPHQVEIFKRVEAAPNGAVGAGRAEVLGFLLRGSALAQVRLPTRKLEVVGDSITCGFGNEASTMDPANVHYTSRNSNGHLAYGAITAALLQAQYSAVAYSGRGVWRNYSGGGGERLPDLYLKSVPDDANASAWEPAQYVPDAVIVNLGTNDFSVPGVDHAAFVSSYRDFLAKLRGYYPNAALVAMLGPMLSDSWPPGENSLRNAQANVEAAIAERAAAGDHDVYLVITQPQSGPWGEDWHPTVATHQRLAQELSARLKEILGW